MVSQYGKEKGDRIYYSYVNRRGLDDTKPMKGQKGTKMKPTKREDIPTKWEDYISRTKKTKFGITKKEEHDCSAEHPDMSHNDYSNAVSALHGLRAAVRRRVSLNFASICKPWYVNN